MASFGDFGSRQSGMAPHAIHIQPTANKLQELCLHDYTIRFSSDETIACRMATFEIQFFCMLKELSIYRLRVPGVAAIELSRTPGTHIAAFNKPHAIILFTDVFETHLLILDDMLKNKSTLTQAFSSRGTMTGHSVDQGGKEGAPNQPGRRVSFVPKVRMSSSFVAEKNNQRKMQIWGFLILLVFHLSFRIFHCTEVLHGGFSHFVCGVFFKLLGRACNCRMIGKQF
ncbi:uncharacterized protein LOC111470729 [Cucurbita maxima]|uniref:Uncharacterized protein LOC111470729 n=1 Tax=Cucurbita maxima TaxID=3661 RepID=A0A6J1IAG9_CUCMA|nr:uncharacterized protein LOC111470729 [Cucurbita maxima]